VFLKRVRGRGEGNHGRRRKKTQVLIIYEKEFFSLSEERGILP
jgi:hypothetical protein